MKTVEQKDWTYSLYENDNGDYILSVVCGKVALYDLNILLNHKEKEAYLKNGTAFIVELASQICSSPSTYQARAVPLY